MVTRSVAKSLWTSVQSGYSNKKTTKFEGRLNLLHEADDDAVIWLESTATAALARIKINIILKIGLSVPATHVKSAS